MQAYSVVGMQQGLQAFDFAPLLEIIDRIPVTDVVWLEELAAWEIKYARSSLPTLKFIDISI